jgi:hypothetical protein
MFDIHAGIGLFDSRHASQNTDLLMQTKISVRVGDFIFYVAKWDKESDRYNYLLRNKKKCISFIYKVVTTCLSLVIRIGAIKSNFASFGAY